MISEVTLSIYRLLKTDWTPVVNKTLQYDRQVYKPANFLPLPKPSKDQCILLLCSICDVNKMGRDKQTQGCKQRHTPLDPNSYAFIFCRTGK